MSKIVRERVDEVERTFKKYFAEKRNVLQQLGALYRELQESLGKYETVSLHDFLGIDQSGGDLKLTMNGIKNREGGYISGEEYVQRSYDAQVLNKGDTFMFGLLLDALERGENALGRKLTGKYLPK